MKRTFVAVLLIFAAAAHAQFKPTDAAKFPNLTNPVLLAGAESRDRPRRWNPAVVRDQPSIRQCAVDPSLTLLSNRGGTSAATVSSGTLHVSGTTIEARQPRAPRKGTN